jgi:hypothetical protein
MILRRILTSNHQMSKVFNTLFLLMLCASCYSIIPPIGNTAVNSTTQEKVLYLLDFSNASNVSDTKKWLKKQGFDIKKNPSALSIYHDKGAFVFETKGQIFSYILKSDMNIANAKKLRITWGVNSFPKNASYENGIRNEALMVYVYYGRNFMDSGSIFIPNSPYFLGLFLSNSDTTGKYYKGSHFQVGGRFVCVGNPKLDETVVSEFDLQKGFKEGFGKDKTVPSISGIGLEVETTKTGKAKAFIKKIEILG